ncbi:unnamed protein product, partial [Candidula unifasciata]
MHILVQVLLALTIVAGTFSQTIKLENTRKRSSCKHEASIGDTVESDVIVTGDIPRLISEDHWEPILTVYVNTREFVIHTICAINMTVPPCKDTSSHGYCTCHQHENGVRIAVVLPLTRDFGKGWLEAKWMQAGGRTIYASPNYHLPEVNVGSVTARVDGMITGPLSEKCWFNVSLRRRHSIYVFCQSGYTEPCYIHLTYGGHRISAAYDYGMTIPEDFTGNMTVGVSVCRATDDGTSNNCSVPRAITAADLTTSTTTVSTTTSTTVSTTSTTVFTTTSTTETTDTARTT